MNEWVNEIALTPQSCVNYFILFKSIEGQIGRTERVTFCNLWNSIEQLEPNSCKWIKDRMDLFYISAL